MTFVSQASKMNSSKLTRILFGLPKYKPITYQRYHLSKLTYIQPSVNTFTDRSHTCGQLTREDIGKRVNLFGWVKYTRFDNKIIALRDTYGTVQCIVDKSQLTKTFRKTTIHNESVIKVSGRVQARPDSQRNESQAVGDIEVLVDNVDILADARGDMPILTRESETEQTNAHRLKYRYLDLRSASLQEALRFRSKVCQIFRQSLQDLAFVECETPTLFRRTPGGANEFVVPSQLENAFYGLTQSPQQLKQLLMIGGLDRYFQICRCYRDESTKSDRQPEFTQLDIELSFTSQEHIMSLINQLMHDLFTKLNADEITDVNLAEIFEHNSRSIARMPYSEAFSKYGTDKPDVRFDWLIEEVGVDGLRIFVPHFMEEEEVSECMADLKAERGPDASDYALHTNPSSAGTEIVIRSRTDEARMILGQLRLKIAARLERKSVRVYRKQFAFLWVIDFPLFAEKADSPELESNHHPFTAPSEETSQYLAEEPLKVIGQHYDLVLNGQEIGGGSIRIHKPALQRFIFENILKIDHSTFEYFTEALSSGCPPHGGIAIGLDRFIAILLGKSSIRDVIAFPKSNSGRCSMSGCPHPIDAETQQMYHIKTVTSASC